MIPLTGDRKLVGLPKLDLRELLNEMGGKIHGALFKRRGEYQPVQWLFGGLH